MKTELLYLVDPNIHRMRATVTEIIASDSSTFIILDRTPAYPQGGGQPGDRGNFTLKGGQEILFGKTVKIRDGKIGHQCNGGLTSVLPGINLVVQIDASTRRYHSRLHTAGELICAALSKLGYYSWSFATACHFPGQCRVAFNLNGETVDKEVLRILLSRELALLINSEGDVRLTQAGTPAELASLCPGEVGKFFPEWPVRIVSPVEGFHRPCLGTHCDQLSEIGPIRLTKIRVRGDELSIGYELSIGM